MTHDRRKQARAVLLSAIMIVSMFGGSLALAGSAAAAANQVTEDSTGPYQPGDTVDFIFTPNDGSTDVQVWIDANGNGNSDSGETTQTVSSSELTTDQSYGGSISLAGDASDGSSYQIGAIQQANKLSGSESAESTSGSFSVDGTSPTGTPSLGTTPISDTETGDGNEVTVTVSFDEDMQEMADDVTVNPDVDGDLTTSPTVEGKSWTGPQEFTADLQFTDDDEEVSGVTLSVMDAQDLAGNTMSEATTQYTVDTLSPAFATDYPAAANIVSNGFNLNVQANEDGTAHYVVLTDGAAAPSAQQVIAGTDGSDSSGVTTGDTGITSSQETTIEVSGLDESTQYDVFVVAEDDAGNTQLSSQLDVTTSGASITADPDGTGQSANHTVKWTLGSQTDVQTYEIDYSQSGDNGADISNVGSEDIVRFGLDTNNDDEIEDSLTDSGDITSVNSVNGGDGTVLTVETSSSVTIDQGTQIILEYNDTVNPTTPTDVALRLDPDIPDVDVTRMLAVGSTPAPQVNNIQISGTEVQTGGPFDTEVNGTDQSFIINFDKDMDQSVTPTTSLTVDGEEVTISDGSWTDTTTWEGTVDINVDNAEVDASVSVSDATGTDGNSLDSETSNDFEIDTASLGIVSATTDENAGTADRIDVTLNDTYSSETTSDFSVTDDDEESITVSGINDNGDDDSTTLELELDSTLSANATPNVTLESGESIQDDAGNSVGSAQEIEAADGVAPTVSSFDLAQEDGRTLNVSLDADEQLDDFTVTINDTEGDGKDADDPSVATLNESDFDESVSDGTYNYTTNYTLSADGTYFASIESAADAAGNDDVDQTTATVSIDQSGPSISADSPEANAIVTSQQDITATIEDDGVGVNSGDIYVTLEDSEGELIDRGRVGGVSGLRYSGGTLTIEAQDGDAFAFAEGDVDVTVEATDTNGEETTESWSFTYTTVTVEEFAADGDEVSVNVSTATNFDNVNATIKSTQSLANEDSVVSETVDLTADGDYYTGTFTAPRDGEYNLNEVVVANAESKTASTNPGNTAGVNTTKPQVANAYISGYDGTDTTVTVQFNEPLTDGTTINTGTETLSVEGEGVTGSTATNANLQAGQVTLTVGGTAVQTGNEPNVSVNTAAHITQRYGGDSNADPDSQTTLHTIQLDLSEDTNFVSVPAAAGTLDLTERDTSGVDVIWTYDEGSWESYDPDKSDGNNDFTALEGGQGYVFEMNNAATLDANVYNVVGGDSQATGTPGQQQLEEGWNLVGHWQEGAQGNSQALSSLDNYTDSRIYTQSGSSYSYSELGGSEFQPGESYWVFVNDDDVYTETGIQ